MWKIILSLAITLFSVSSLAALLYSDTLTFEGQLLDDNGDPIAGPADVKFQIYNPNGTCLLYEETYSALALDSKGNFAVKIGGSGTGTRNTAADGNLNWKTIFQNGSSVRTYDATYCNPAYSSSLGEIRKLRVTVNATVLTPDFTLSPAPSASVAETLQGKTASDFVTISGNANLSGPIQFDNYNELRFSNAASYYVGFRAPIGLSASNVWELPLTDGANGQVLKTNGAGALGWVTFPTNYSSGGSMGGNLFITASNSLTVSGRIWTSSDLTVDGNANIAGLLYGNTGYFSSGLEVSSYGSAATPSVMVGGTNGLYSTSGNDLGFGVFGTERLTIDNSGMFKFIGKASIGTAANPSATLHLPGSTTAAGSAPLKINSGTLMSTAEAGAIEYDGTYLYYTDGGSVRRQLASTTGLVSKAGDSMTGVLGIQSGTAATPGLSVSGDSDTGLYAPAANSIALSTLGTQRLVINGSGYVGIGTTAPSTLLTVSSSGTALTPFTIQTNPAASTNISTIVLNNTHGAGNWQNQISLQSAGAEKWAIGNDSTATGSNDFFIWDNAVGAMRLLINTNGYVGINTATPSVELDINGLMRITRQGSGSTPNCNGSNDSAIALTYGRKLCVCNGSTWVNASDGSTACTF